MTPEEMRSALLVSEKTGLPNRRAFDEGKASPGVAMSDVNGPRIMNDNYGYSAGDILIQRSPGDKFHNVPWFSAPEFQPWEIEDISAEELAAWKAKAGK